MLKNDSPPLLFSDPDRSLAQIHPVLLAKLLASAADVALVIDGGVIQDVSMGNAELAKEDYHQSWRGKRWVETVTVESRPKIEEILSSVGENAGDAKEPGGRSRWRQVNHPSSSGLDLPVSYTAIQLGRADRIIALGRDLRAISTLQQRLVEAHQTLEREYSRLRSAETRYKLLFESISQPVLIVDTLSLEVTDLNPAAGRILGVVPRETVGSSLDELFGDPDSILRGKQLIAEARATGESSALKLKLKLGGLRDLAGSAYRDAESTKVIMRILPAPSEATSTATGAGAATGTPQDRVMGMLEELPDGLLVVGSDLRILAANKAFADLTSFVNNAQLVRLPITDFLGRSPTELNVLISNLKNHGVVRNFTTVLRDRFGEQEDVEVSAVATSQAASTTSRNVAAFGFSVRSVARRLRTSPRVSEALPSSVDQLTSLVGRVPMKEIVQESTVFIEKLCIEAALEMTGDNRASAAEMLGLSRQGLYSKLKRFGFDN